MSNLLHLANQIARRPWNHAAEPFRMLQEMDHLLRDPFFAPVTRDFPLRSRRFARPQVPQRLTQQQQQQQQPQQPANTAQSEKAVQQSQAQSQSNAVAENENARAQPVSRWSNRWMADPFFNDSVFAPSRFERDLWGRFDPFFNQMERTALPETEVSETEKAYLVTLDVPGVRKEDVKIRLGGRDNRTLTITAERREETEEAIENTAQASESAQPSAAGASTQAASSEQATVTATASEPAAASEIAKATDPANNSVQVQAPESNNKVARPTRRSVSSFRFSQTLELPENADVKGISAKCEHGQLRLTIPKMEMAPEEEHTIPIQ